MGPIYIAAGDGLSCAALLYHAATCCRSGAGIVLSATEAPNARSAEMCFMAVRGRILLVVTCCRMWFTLPLTRGLSTGVKYFGGPTF